MQDSGGQVLTVSSRDCRSVFCEEGHFTIEQVDLTLQSFTLFVWISFISKLVDEQILKIIECVTSVINGSIQIPFFPERYLLPFLVLVLCVIYTITSLVYYYQEVHWSTAV